MLLIFTLFSLIHLYSQKYLQFLRLDSKHNLKINSKKYLTWNLLELGVQQRLVCQETIDSCEYDKNSLINKCFGSGKATQQTICFSILSHFRFQSFKRFLYQIKEKYVQYTLIKNLKDTLQWI